MASASCAIPVWGVAIFGIFVLLSNMTDARITVQGKSGVTYDYSINVQNSVEIEIINEPGGPYRVEVNSTDAQRENPVLVVVRAQKSILSWKIPLLVETVVPNTTFVDYNETARTLCTSLEDCANGRIVKDSTKFTIILWTHSTQDISVKVRTYPVAHYFLQANTNYSVTFSPSQPLYYAYEFPDDNATFIQLLITSDDDVCFTVSLQQYICPIYDLQAEIAYEGTFHTMSKKGALVIRRNDFEIGDRNIFAIVFVAHSDNSKCDTNALNNEEENITTNRQTSVVNFTIKATLKHEEHYYAIYYLLGINLVAALVIIFVTCLFHVSGKYSKIGVNERELEVAEDEKITDETIDMIQRKDDPRLTDFITQPNRNNRKGFNYFCHIANIGIFYSLPVLQLMVHYHRAVDYSGDRDECYFNHQCSHSFLNIMDFNHVYSNLGYIFFGLLFLGITAYRKCNVWDRAGHGIPKLYGLYFAMGLALILEGVLSACYHICPNQANFQFDTSFMYVIAMLILSKLYQNRHPDIQTSAYTTFTMLGLFVMLAMFGIIYNSKAVYIVFYFVYCYFCFYLALKLYFFDRVTKRLQTIFTAVIDNEMSFIDALVPKRCKQFLFVLAGYTCNMVLLLSGFFIYPNHVDFGTYLLIILMGNAILYTFFYTAMKYTRGERLCTEAMFYGLLSIGFWVTGAIYFFNAATHWEKTPAQSRLDNQDCIVLNFYDRHDLWHILSAFALFFTFSYLQTMDDDLVDKKRNTIKVF